MAKFWKKMAKGRAQGRFFRFLTSPVAAGGKGDKPPKADLMLGVCQLTLGWRSDNA